MPKVKGARRELQGLAPTHGFAVADQNKRQGRRQSVATDTLIPTAPVRENVLSHLSSDPPELEYDAKVLDSAPAEPTVEVSQESPKKKGLFRRISKKSKE